MKAATVFRAASRTVGAMLMALGPALGTAPVSRRGGPPDYRSGSHASGWATHTAGADEAGGVLPAGRHAA